MNWAIIAPLSCMSGRFGTRLCQHRICVVVVIFLVVVFTVIGVGCSTGMSNVILSGYIEITVRQDRKVLFDMIAIEGF